MGKIEYITAFRAAATQMNGYRTGREWVEAGVDLDDAIAWANLGFLPTEALPMIAEGHTPASVAAVRDAMSTGDRHQDAISAIMLATGGTADPDVVRAALVAADNRAGRRAEPWNGGPPDVPAADVLPISAPRREEIIAALNSGNDEAEIIWMGIHDGVIMARLIDGTDLNRTADGWTG